MYYLKSDLSQKEYLSNLKRTFRNPFLIFDERVCGIIIGPFFSVAYHSPYEWNRRITSECNRAWGFVEEAEGKTHVTFFRGKGMLSPFWLILYAMIVYGIFFFSIGHYPVFIWISVVISLAVCLVSALESVITEQGEAGFHEVTRLLLNPSEYYG